MTMKRITAYLLTALLMGGCGSSVKLDDVPVVDRSSGGEGAAAGQGQAGAGGAGTSGVSETALSPVELKAQTDLTSPSARVILFDYDSFVVKPEYQPLVQAHADRLLADKALHVMLEGHTDERGGREYNLALGQKRAEAVLQALRLLGVPDAQMEPVSFGEEKPAAQGSSEADWAQNRRTEINYR